MYEVEGDLDSENSDDENQNEDVGVKKGQFLFIYGDTGNKR